MSKLEISRLTVSDRRGKKTSDIQARAHSTTLYTSAVNDMLMGCWTGNHSLQLFYGSMPILPVDCDVIADFCLLSSQLFKRACSVRMFVSIFGTKVMADINHPAFSIKQSIVSFESSLNSLLDVIRPMKEINRLIKKYCSTSVPLLTVISTMW